MVYPLNMPAAVQVAEKKQLPLRTNGYKPRIAFNPLLQTIILFSVGDWCTKYPSSLSKADNSGLQLSFCTLQV
ncbi:hypothetical protein T03_9500 [Trichinella britovi]|uniref:Uncharacterized protein n=1 Tax=Trichinella britovi TaxID=45882 RepID=A0A0V1CCI9_TRIBR|nr:hypothetical protein T03_9500 [Trichinella britovi]